MDYEKLPDPGSELMARELACTRRQANILRNKDGFPPVYWIGRQWRVDREAYELWKVLCYKKNGGK